MGVPKDISFCPSTNLALTRKHPRLVFFPPTNDVTKFEVNLYKKEVIMAFYLNGILILRFVLICRGVC